MAKHEYATKPPNITTMPPGVPYIIGNEAAERFSFYGMRSILIVFMTTHLMPIMGDAEARGWVSVFIGSIYGLSILGAVLAEGFLGKYRTIFYLSIVYCLGHLALAFMDTPWGLSLGQRWVLAIGLTLIAFGGGGIKPCVSANVGDQFGESNKHLLSKVFGWFYFSINAGSFVATLLCPFLLADPRFGAPWAFGIPGVAMFIATVFFWAGRKRFVHIPPGGMSFVKEFFSSEGLQVIRRLAGIYIFIAVFWSLWDQSVGHAWTLQAERMDLNFLGFQLLPAQVNTANAILILLFIPLVNYVLYPFISRFFPLTPLRKIGIGLFLTAASFLVIAYVQHLIDGGARPTIWWQMLAYVILTMGEVMVSITGLEFSYTQAPNKMKSAVMSLWLLTVAAGNFFTAGVNFVIQNEDGTKKMDDLQYYLFFAGLMALTACIFAFVARFYKGRTYLQSQDEVATEPVLAAGTPT
ncbi:MAG: POT family MFS transporter [Verrucomicrobiota bacterium]|nr:POT family MFS transporter [Verrucomicrobiota bacterium]